MSAFLPVTCTISAIAETYRLSEIRSDTILILQIQFVFLILRRLSEHDLLEYEWPDRLE